VLHVSVGDKLGSGGQSGRFMVAPDHYHTLRVIRGAEDAVIRGAYRALVRIYHPQNNPQLYAEAHLQEINAAYEVLSDPLKRAAYDSIGIKGGTIRVQQGVSANGDQLPREQMHDFGYAWLAEDEAAGDDSISGAPRPPRRSLAVLATASAALAVIVISILASWHSAVRLTPPPEQRAADRLATKTDDGSSPNVGAEEPTREVPSNDPKLSSSGVDVQTALMPASVADRTFLRASRQSQRVMKRQAPGLVAKGEAHSPRPSSKTPAAEPATPPASEICRTSPGGATGRCTNARLPTVERVAKGFAAQSMQHADWRKQQLILSARARAITARQLCRSEECVADAYVRQIREISEIMEGGNQIPGKRAR
jgi:hypothetical protein